MKDLIVAYVPVVHAGYINFFRKYNCSIAVIDSEKIVLPAYIKRDIRAVSPELASLMIKSENESFWGNPFSGDVFVAGGDILRSLGGLGYRFIMPREDVSLAIANEYFLWEKVVFEDIFLRWNWENVEHQKEVSVDRTVSLSAAERELMKKAYEVGGRSHDWWRQVGALLVCNGEVLVEECNKHMPSQQTHCIVGDPRIPFKPGERTDLSSAMHAERAVIASAAKHGIKTYRASIFVTTFPCPACAMDIAQSGITRVYFTHGYSLLGAEEILKAYGVEIVHVPQP